MLIDTASGIPSGANFKHIMHPTMHGRYMQALLDAQAQWLAAPWSFPNEQVV